MVRQSHPRMRRMMPMNLWSAWRDESSISCPGRMSQKTLNKLLYQGRFAMKARRCVHGPENQILISIIFMTQWKQPFRAFIRVVKSLNKDNPNLWYTGLYWGFDAVEVIAERLIYADDKNHVKAILLEKYPQFFPTQKIYEKETKDTAQFFYAVIYPLFEWEIKLIEEWEWKCEYCWHIHENKYIDRPYYESRLFWDSVLFCNKENCLEKYKKEKYSHLDLPDDIAYIKSDSPNYIYKCTHKETWKSYIGKTRNAPFFRWWNHLTHSTSPFWLHLRQSKLSDWAFEVLEILPPEASDSEVFKVESEYMVKFDTIKNWFNTVISNKSVLPKEEKPQKDVEGTNQLSLSG